MPQITLEYSNNIKPENLQDLFKITHEILVKKLPTELSSCKTRTMEHSIYRVGDGNPLNAFVHMHLQVMKGRSVETLDNTGKELIAALKTHFDEFNKGLNLQITLEITELSSLYYKAVYAH